MAHHTEAQAQIDKLNSFEGQYVTYGNSTNEWRVVHVAAQLGFELRSGWEAWGFLELERQPMTGNPRGRAVIYKRIRLTELDKLKVVVFP